MVSFRICCMIPTNHCIQGVSTKQKCSQNYLIGLWDQYILHLQLHRPNGSVVASLWCSSCLMVYVPALYRQLFEHVKFLTYLFAFGSCTWVLQIRITLSSRLFQAVKDHFLMRTFQVDLLLFFNALNVVILNSLWLWLKVVNLLVTCASKKCFFEAWKNQEDEVINIKKYPVSSDRFRNFRDDLQRW